MNRAGSVGFQSPLMCCHWRLIPAMNWKPRDRFFTATKNLSRGFQFMAGINRQWQHMSGDWNPTDPARFIQPGAFANDKLLYMPRGNNEENSLPLTTGTTVHTYGPTWQE